MSGEQFLAKNIPELQKSKEVQFSQEVLNRDKNQSNPSESTPKKKSWLQELREKQNQNGEPKTPYSEISSWLSIMEHIYQRREPDSSLKADDPEFQRQKKEKRKDWKKFEKVITENMSLNLKRFLSPILKNKHK